MSSRHTIDRERGVAPDYGIAAGMLRMWYFGVCMAVGHLWCLCARPPLIYI